ncbi:MAG TPA: hypothetical protein VHV79_03830 [Mycobacteriales bacterium]|jgi:hypothetical protein|nr:hypothetical protein [Mycobacteriales bacterium]
MANFILTFRAPEDTQTGDESAWMQWFGELGGAIVDMGSRVGATSPLGAAPSDSVVTGFTTIKADNLEAAVLLAKGCPAIAHGGGVEVGELIAM